MADSGQDMPSLISIVWVDGCGKSTLSNWLRDELELQGYTNNQIWPKFVNYLSRSFFTSNWRLKRLSR